MDATLFLRFAKMCRNIFTCVAIVGCGAVIPVNLITATNVPTGISAFTRLTPLYVSGNVYWIFVICAYVFDIIICFFLWRNYRAVLRLRRAYFDSPEYQKSLHSRTLLVTEISKGLRTDEGLVKIVEQAKDVGRVPTTAIARNVKDLPDLLEEHNQTVRKLEAVLAKYLKNPDKPLPKRPTCKANKTDKAYRKGQHVDAIDYLTARIRELEIEIKEVRESVDKRNAMSYGFASYESISDAHIVAYAARKKGPEGTHIALAPKPQDLIWKNLPMSTTQRNWARFYNNIWVTLLTIGWLVPNGLIAIFLSNLSNLAKLWPAFKTSYEGHSTLWAIVQGVAAPALTSLFYFFLPAIFRRLSMNSGDLSKTSRERHVTAKLYTFFIINNLFLFSLFAAIWGYVTSVISAKNNENEGVWQAIQEGQLFAKGVTALISVSTYWATWLLQRNLGAAVDLSQLVNLAWGSFSRHYLSPTPREVIELSAPQPFDYAGYYNYFLFYSTVAMCFATLQPIVLPITAVYFWLDSYLKKYLLLYVFITKTESGGQFWRVCFNRFVFLAFLGNCIIALLVGAKGSTWSQLIAMGPLPFLLLAFKVYCAMTFDKNCRYYTRGTREGELEVALNAEQDMKIRRGDRVGVRFGHPVLYKALITPMVHAKSQHLLREIYTGRTTDDGVVVAGYSDVYLDPMLHDQPGKTASRLSAPFEIVTEADMDFANFKNRAEFREGAGGDGELYGRPNDLIRLNTNGTVTTSDAASGIVRPDSRASDRSHDGVTYPAGYQRTPNFARDHSPAASVRSMDIGGNGIGDMRHYRTDSNGSEGHAALLGSAAHMGRVPESNGRIGLGQSQLGYSNYRMGGGPVVYTPGETPPGEGEDTSYDYFRRGRQGR